MHASAYRGCRTNTVNVSALIVDCRNKAKPMPHQSENRTCLSTALPGFSIRSSGLYTNSAVPPPVDNVAVYRFFWAASCVTCTALCDSLPRFSRTLPPSLTRCKSSPSKVCERHKTRQTNPALREQIGNPTPMFIPVIASKEFTH